MKTLVVVQHTSAEYLGLIEDHLEGRRIRFQYNRPFTEKGKVPVADAVEDGLCLLGGGPWGSAGARDVPTLNEEIELTRHCLEADIPIIAIGLGAQILAHAAGGGATAEPLSFSIGEARRVEPQGLNGYLPERYPLITYMRDRPLLPVDARILAVDEHDRPALFQIGETALGFAGHPGVKLAMMEDLIMEFEEGPAAPDTALAAVRESKTDVEDALVQIMTGVVQLTGLMRS
jgi:GMP synthase-like glutamine amidotransferase